MAAKNGSEKATGKKTTRVERKKRKQRKIAILAIEAVVVVVLIVALYLITKLDVIHKDEISDEDIVTNDTVDDSLLVDEDDVEINDNISEHMQGYRNIALFGVDARNNNLGKGVRSDTIIIASINESTKEVKLVSVYRDTYLNLGTDKYSKATEAYAAGGAKQAINMLNMNLDMNITDYVTVGWAAVADTVDALGGIEIDVDSEELKHLNNYQVETAESLGRSYTKLTETGLVTLDGIQAVSYCRIRYTAGDDFKRAERQREVIQALADKAQSVAKSNPSKLDTIANEVFPQTATSLTLSEILELVADIGSYEIVDTSGFPVAEYRTTGLIRSADCVIPVDLETNVMILHEFLFGDVGDYTPSAEVQSYGEIIRQDSGTSKVTDYTSGDTSSEDTSSEDDSSENDSE